MPEPFPDSAAPGGAPGDFTDSGAAPRRPCPAHGPEGEPFPAPDLPSSLADLRIALASGRRQFAGLSLSDLDGVDLDLSGCDLRGGCFREARFGHARFTDADGSGCGFQQALLWGADL